MENTDDSIYQTVTDEEPEDEKSKLNTEKTFESSEKSEAYKSALEDSDRSGKESSFRVDTIFFLN